MKKRKITAVLLSAMIMITIAGMSVSMAVTATVEFKAGPFTVGDISINPFNGGAPIELTGQDQSLTATINDFRIVDARGNNKGWMVRVSATPFEDDYGNTLHEGALTMSGLSVRRNGNSDPVDETCFIAESVGMTMMPQTLIYMPESKGKGTYYVTDSELTLDVWPSEALATTYSSTLTFDLVTNVK